MTFKTSTSRMGLVAVTDVTLAASLGQPGITQLPSITTEPQFGEVITAWDPNLGSGEFMYARCATTVVAAQTISSITVSAGTATMTTGSAHGLAPGYTVIITGAAPAGYNGTFTVLTTGSATTLTFATTATANATTVGAYTVGIGAGQVCELAYTLTSGTLVITATPWTGTTVQGKPLGVAVNNMASAQASWFQVEGPAITVCNGTMTSGSPVYWQANGTVSNTGVASKQMVNATAASAAAVTINSGSSAVVLPAFQALVFLNRPFAQGAIT